MATGSSSLTAVTASAELAQLLRGTWRNQLGSMLTLEADGAGGLLGAFVAGTGSAAQTPSPVIGSYDPAPDQPGTVLGFMAKWTQLHAVTVWAGQYHPGDDLIRATWLMTAETDEGGDWRSTVVGHDVFRRATPLFEAPGQ